MNYGGTAVCKGGGKTSVWNIKEVESKMRSCRGGTDTFCSARFMLHLAKTQIKPISVAALLKHTHTLTQKHAHTRPSAHTQTHIVIMESHKKTQKA